MKHPLQRDSRRALRDRNAASVDPVAAMPPLPEWLTLQYLSPDFSAESAGFRLADSPQPSAPPHGPRSRDARRGKS